MRIHVMVFFLGLFLVAPTISASSSAVYWAGDENCGTLFQTPLDTLPGGALLIGSDDENGMEAEYELRDGSRLVLRIEDPEASPIYGTSFNDAMVDLDKRKPLQVSETEFQTEGLVMASVKISKSYSYLPHVRRGQRYLSIKPGSMIIELEAEVRSVTWDGYETASATDKALWDKFQCRSYHHELGHILIDAQLFEETIYDWSRVRGQDLDDMAISARHVFDDIAYRISERHDDYHKAISDMGFELADSRPYLDLPFAWLNRDQY